MKSNYRRIPILCILILLLPSPAVSQTAVYHIMMDQDDGIEKNDTIWFRDGYPGKDPECCIGNIGNNRYDAGFRFHLDNVSQGDQLVFARLKFHGIHSIRSNDVEFTISGVDQDSPTGFTQFDRPSGKYPLTSATVNWNIFAPWRENVLYYSPDISPIINEILSRPGWGTGPEGKTLVVLVDTSSPPNFENTFVGYNDYIGEVEKEVTLELSSKVMDTFIGGVSLSRPTNSSIWVNLISPISTDLYVEYDITPANGANRFLAVHPNILLTTTPEIYPANRPIRIKLPDLLSDTSYDYRIRVRKAGEVAPYEYGDFGSFMTKRQKGSTFNFSILADSHMGLMTEEDDPGYLIGLQTVENARTTAPDFFITMGDEVMTYMYSLNISNKYDAMVRYSLVKKFFSRLASLSPIYYVLGNHDGELSWADAEMQRYSHIARKHFINNPDPDTYSYGGGEYCNYFAWEWGDALFVCLDPFYNTGDECPYSIKPYGSAWTLGPEQKQWLETVLSVSGARFKLLFSHHILASWAYNGYGRGGAKYAHDYEQGEIHQMMIDYGVQAFFYGHDHVFADSTADGIHYTCCGRPGWRVLPSWTDPGNPLYPYFVDAYPYGWTNDYGFVNVTVSPSTVMVEYVLTAMDRSNGTVIAGYDIDSPNVLDSPIAYNQPRSTRDRSSPNRSATNRITPKRQFTR